MLRFRAPSIVVHVQLVGKVMGEVALDVQQLDRVPNRIYVTQPPDVLRMILAQRVFARMDIAEAVWDRMVAALASTILAQRIRVW